MTAGYSSLYSWGKQGGITSICIMIYKHT